MSWLSRALGKDKKDEQRQLKQWHGAGPGQRAMDATIAEGDRYKMLQGNYDQSRNAYQNFIQNGQQAFETSARAAVNAAMPAFNSQLEGVRASAIRRGVNNGELGTSYEGDLASALNKNLDNSIASQALGLYGQQLGAYSNLAGMDLGASEASINRYQDENFSYLDRKEQERQQKAQNQMGWANLGIKAIGTFMSKGKGGLD